VRGFGYPGLFGAYNVGPARYAACIEARRPLPDEPRTYVALLAEPCDGGHAAGEIVGDAAVLHDHAPRRKVGRRARFRAESTAVKRPFRAAYGISGPRSVNILRLWKGRKPLFLAQYPAWIAPPEGRRRIRIFPAIGRPFLPPNAAPRWKK